MTALETLNKRLRYFFTGKTIKYNVSQHTEQGVMAKQYLKTISELDNLIDRQREQLKELSSQNIKLMKVNTDGRMWDLAEDLLKNQLGRTNNPPSLDTSPHQTKKAISTDLDENLIREQLKQVPQAVLRRELATTPEDEMIQKIQTNFKLDEANSKKAYAIAREVLNEN